MATAWLLTLLAVIGISFGVVVGKSRVLSNYFAAAGGGLLFGVALFWLIPEIAEISGWVRACLLAIVAASAMFFLDRLLLHGTHGHGSGRHVLTPLLFAASIHAFLDGWSVRALAGHPLADVAVPLGLAMHKIPEGVALGWATHRIMKSGQKALAASAAVECATLLGASVEPKAITSGSALFGPWWPATILAIVAGSFLFLGAHALAPSVKRPLMVAIFVATVVLMAVIRA